MKINKPLLKSPALLNVSIHREVLDTVGDFLSAVIIEFIHYRVIRNDKKRVWLQIDWIHKQVPYISRSGLAKKLKKLVADEHIIEKEGEGRHYHKRWYSLSTDLREACNGKGMDPSKVYYNLDIAKRHLEASVIYATIVNLLKVREEPLRKVKHAHINVGVELGRVDDKLLLNYTKLVEGSGLTLSKVRKAVRWLIDHKKIEAKKVFGNKVLVSLPTNILIHPDDWESYLSDDLPTESFPHFEPGEEELPTESYPHKS